jgi:hypothetical protein
MRGLVSERYQSNDIQKNFIRFTVFLKRFSLFYLILLPAEFNNSDTYLHNAVTILVFLCLSQSTCNYIKLFAEQSDLMSVRSDDKIFFTLKYNINIVMPVIK